jgi:hypothetical protein
MRPIKFAKINADKINAILTEVNGKASDHTYRSFNNFSADAEAVIWKIENLLGGKKYCPGAKFSIESGNSVPSAYKYTRIGTRVEFECRASGWFVTEIKRADIWSKGGESKIMLTPAHHDRAVNVLKSGYFITN